MLYISVQRILKNCIFRKHRQGFSLAEVLIAVLIIGLIAALTLPALMDKYHKTFYLSAFKKKFRVFSEVVNLALTENGKIEYWDTSLSVTKFFSTYFGKYIDVSSCSDCWVSDSSDGGSSSSGTSVSTKYVTSYVSMSPPSVPAVTYNAKDGTTIGFSYGNKIYWGTSSSNSTGGYQVVYFYVDVNGTKGPNKYGLDKFVFQIYNDELIIPFTGYITTYYNNNWTNACTSSSRIWCGAWIVENNWTYPDDFPFD